MKRQTINSHYTYETRAIIENLLNENKSITEISLLLNRDRSNIAREIKKHKAYVFPSSFNGTQPCLKYNSCSLKSFECFKYCKNIEINLCEKLIPSPHVCNGCNSKKHCRHVKLYYKANEANNEYINNWHNDRTGLHYTEEELNVLNTDFKFLVLKNKSIYHSLLIINNRGFNFKERTIYDQIKHNRLDINSNNLPRPRKNKNKDSSNDNQDYKRNIDGHTYEDYINYKENNSSACELQMDTVEGIKENNAPVLLTLEIVEIKFLFIFKISKQTIDKVVEEISNFKDAIGKDEFDHISKILLTDNGKEFINIEKIESISSNINLFYCHPYSSFEKGSIENNHELIRRVIPKGVSLKIYTQKDINLLCSHINSLYRKELDGKCPFDLIGKYIQTEKLNRLGLIQINPEKVTLIPELLGVKNIDNIKKYLDDNDIKKANIYFNNQI
jgi:IS30 family transposase